MHIYKHTNVYYYVLIKYIWYTIYINSYISYFLCIYKIFIYLLHNILTEHVCLTNPVWSDINIIFALF